LQTTTLAPHRENVVSNSRRTIARFGTASLYLPLFVTLLVAFAYTPPRWQDWNQNSRFNLTRAIVENGSVRIDEYVANTGDYAKLNGHYYTDKAPGLSLMAVPVYALTNLAGPIGLDWLAQRLSASAAFTDTLNPDGQGTSEERVAAALALYIATLVCVALPAAVMLVLLAKIIERLAGCRTAALLATLAIGLATPVFSYAQAFYGHIPAAACIVGAFALLALSDDARLSTARLLGVGALLGGAVVIEYPAALAGIPVALWAVQRAGGRAALLGIAGALPVLAILAAYDLTAFGTPLPIGYEHSELWQEQHEVGFMSLTYPRLETIWGLSFSPFRGLFYLAPVLLLALPGIWLSLRSTTQRIPVLVATSSFALMFLFASASAMWWGGFAVGPRYLLPGLPLLAIPLGVVLARVNAASLPHRLVGLAAFAILATVSALHVWATTLAGQSFPPDTTRRPLTDYVLPALQDGNVARNLGMALHLRGVASLMPLLIALGLAVLLLGRQLLATRRDSFQ
jgi:hypothetical protein